MAKNSTYLYALADLTLAAATALEKSLAFQRQFAISEFGISSIPTFYKCACPLCESWRRLSGILKRSLQLIERSEENGDQN